jgi:hypothetical protein
MMREQKPGVKRSLTPGFSLQVKSEALKPFHSFVSSRCPSPLPGAGNAGYELSIV